MHMDGRCNPHSLESTSPESIEKLSCPSSVSQIAISSSCKQRLIANMDGRYGYCNNCAHCSLLQTHWWESLSSVASSCQSSSFSTTLILDLLSDHQVLIPPSRITAHHWGLSVLHANISNLAKEKERKGENSTWLSDYDSTKQYQSFPSCIFVFCLFRTLFCNHRKRWPLSTVQETHGWGRSRCNHS